eukprot:8830662-Alexandrium_andersonii.AAC.1
MEALFASCSEGFRNLKDPRAQETTIVENLKSEVFNFSQVLRNLDHRISALEARPPGVQSVPMGGPSNP